MKNKEIAKKLYRIKSNLEIKGKRRREENTGVKGMGNTVSGWTLQGKATISDF